MGTWITSMSQLLQIISVSMYVFEIVPSYFLNIYPEVELLNPAGASGEEPVYQGSSIPSSKRSPGGGHDNSLQYFCLGNPMDRGGWQATVHRIAQNWTQLK